MSLFPDSTSPQNQVKTGWTVSQALDWNACTVAPCCFNMYLTRVSAREYNFNCWYNFKQRWKSSHNWVRMMRVQRNLQSCENSPEISLGMGEHHFMITERFSSIQFSSVQDGIYAFETPHNYALHPVSEKSPQRCPWNSTNVRLIGDGHLSSFQGRSSSAPSFYASLLQESDVVMSFVFYENVSVSEDTAEEVCAAELVSVSLKWPATMRQGGLRSQSWLS